MDPGFANSYLGKITAGAVCIWFFFWPYRRKYELDYKLDGASNIVRWAVVLSGLGAALLPGLALRYARVAWGIVSVAFLAWPNFAYHLTRLLRRCRLLPAPHQPLPDGPAGPAGGTLP